MKITTKRFVMGCCIAAGMFSILVAYRAGQPQAETFEFKSQNFDSLKNVTDRNLVRDGFEVPDMVPVRVASNTIETEFETQMEQASTPAMEPEPFFEEPALAVEAPAVETGVESFNYLPNAVADVPEMMAEATKVAPVEPVAVPTVPQINRPVGQGVNTAPWKKNPFVSPQSRSAEPSAEPAFDDNFDFQAPPEVSATEAPTLESPILDVAPAGSTVQKSAYESLGFSSTDAAPIGVLNHADEQPTEAQIEVTVDDGTSIETTSFASPLQSVVETAAHSTPVAAPAQAITTNVIAGLDKAAATRAVHHIEYGKSLARRNAVQAATQEFYSALHVLAQSNDQQTETSDYTGALRKGVTAMKEAADFMVEDPQFQIQMNVASIIEAHESRLIGKTEARHMTATEALQRYYIFAGEQLGLCGGQNVVSAEALYCLGKLTSVKAMGDANPQSYEVSKSIVFHNAAVGADPQNYRSANELGVLLARQGELDFAEAWLKQSLAIHPVAQSWGNLAKVHERKATAEDQDLAARAGREYEIALHSEWVGTPVNGIRWMEPDQFAKSSPPQPGETIAKRTPTPAVVPATNVEALGDKKQSIAERIRDWVPNKLIR